jgi:hypothetical protein
MRHRNTDAGRQQNEAALNGQHDPVAAAQPGAPLGLLPSLPQGTNRPCLHADASRRGGRRTGRPWRRGNDRLRQRHRLLYGSAGLLCSVLFLVLGLRGLAWWDLRHPVPPQEADYQALMRTLLRQAPGDRARRLGVPVVHAAQAGEFEGLTPGNETVPYVCRFLGEAQITDGHGNVLARLA